MDLSEGTSLDDKGQRWQCSLLGKDVGEQRWKEAVLDDGGKKESGKMKADGRV